MSLHVPHAKNIPLWLKLTAKQPLGSGYRVAILVLGNRHDCPGIRLHSILFWN